MVKVLNMFREFSMERVKGYNKLPNWQKDLFDATYKKHLSSIPIEDRTNFAEYRIKGIVGERSVIKVYFDNGDCYFYLPGNQWVKVSVDKFQAIRSGSF